MRSKSRTIAVLVAGLGILLSACASSKPFATVDGFCAALEQGGAKPTNQILGRTSYDQPWIDETTEGLVAGCQWQRPAPRPAAWDMPTRVVGGKVVPVPKKRSVWNRLRHPNPNAQE